ncbi:MAG: branched-chain amino acid ABC transporter permease [Candidatus Thorarchaeota archaeon]|nr:MAG: branched-chain amino acid ABC transporter permease [Candidatus Thorarchaeota archaeon]
MMRLQLDLRSFFERFKIWAVSFRGSITLIALAGLSLFPPITRSVYWTQILISAMIFAIFAASWDLLAGYAGQVSFGHSVFFGAAGYVTAALVRYLGVNWILSLIAGAFAAVLFSLLIGIPCLRLKGPYLALGTLAFSLILLSLFYMGPPWSDILGGSEGISGLPVPPNIFVAFYLVLGFMIISLFGMHAIVESRLGTLLKAIRDDETCADASGINTTVYKLIAFMLSGFFAGIAGSLFVLQQTAVNPAYFQPLYSFYAIIMASIGGIATIFGSIAGSFIFWILSEFLRPLAAAALLIFATLLILIVRFAEEGVMNPVMERIQEYWDKFRGM